MYLTEVGPQRIVAAIVFVGQGLGENNGRGEPESVLLEQDRRDRIPGLRGQMHRHLLGLCRLMGTSGNSFRAGGYRRICVADGWDCNEWCEAGSCSGIARPGRPGEIVVAGGLSDNVICM